MRTLALLSIPGCPGVLRMSDLIDATNEVGVMSKRAELANVREVRAYGISDIEVRDESVDGSVTFAGYASVFNHGYEVHDSFGSFTERLSPGAFARTLTEQPDVMLLINHQGLPLARTKSGTLSLSEDSVGLRVEAKLDGNDPDVRAILPKMRRGDVDEMSFAFRVNAQEWSDDYSERTITEVNLARGDVSIVSFGANPATLAQVRAALADENVRAQLFAELDEQRVLTTEAVAQDGEPAVDVAEVVEAVEPVDAAELVDVADLFDTVDAEVVESADEVVGEDEARQQGSTVSVSYYLSQLVDRRLSA